MSNEDYNTLRTQLTLAEQQRDAAVETLGSADKTLLGIADELTRKPVDCLGVADDGLNQWPIRDEMIDDTKKARKGISDTLAYIRELGEMEADSVVSTGIKPPSHLKAPFGGSAYAPREDRSRR